MTRAGSGRGPCTWGRVRSEPTASCQARLIGLAAARKNRRARSRSPPASVSCRAAAWSAATDMPRAYAGLEPQSASPKTSSPAGKRRNCSYLRRRLAGKRVADDVVERLGVTDRSEDVGRGDGLDEGEEGLGVGRRVVAVVPDQRQDPPVLLLGDQHEAGGPGRLRTHGGARLNA